MMNQKWRKRSQGKAGRREPNEAEDPKSHRQQRSDSENMDELVKCRKGRGGERQRYRDIVTVKRNCHGLTMKI